MFRKADLVIEAAVIKSRRWQEGTITIHLVATYRVLDVFKGKVKAGNVVIVTDTCLDKAVPRRMQGYPVVRDYCLGGMHLHLTGVNSKDGSPKASKDVGGWIIYLKRDERKGAPQQTWLEVDRTGFGGGCGYSREDLGPAEKDGFDRMQNRRRR